MAISQKILIVDDDNNIAELTNLYLTKECFETMIVNDGESALEAVKTFEPNLILLDLMLPGIDGYQVCREVRATSQIPIVIMSAKGEVFDKVLGLELGADDYIAKPFDINFLVAKINALLRRSYVFSESQEILEHRDAFLNTGDSTLTYKGERIELTKNEYRILYTLLRNKGKVVSRESLMENLWQSDLFVDDNTLTVNINRLRKKLDDAGLTEFILTKHKKGYIIE